MGRIDLVFKDAQSALAAGNPELALALYREVLDYESAHGGARAGKADAHRMLGEFRHCLQELSVPISGRPQFMQTFLVGLDKSQARLMLSATSDFLDALASQPSRNDIRVHLVFEYNRLGWVWEAFHNARRLGVTAGTWWEGVQMTAFDKYASRRKELFSLLAVRRTDPATFGARERFTAANLLADIGYFKLAKALCRQFMEGNPSSFGAFRLCSNIILRTEGRSAALNFLSGISESFRDLLEYKFELSDILAADGQLRAAIEALESVPDIVAREHVAALLALFYALSGNYSEFHRFCLRWHERAPTTRSAQFVVCSSRTSRLLPLYPSSHTPELFPNCLSVIVQYWNDENVPCDVLDAMHSWKHFNPTWQHLIFSDFTASEFILEKYGGDVLDLFEKCHHPAMRADFFRVAYLLSNGGFYADVDEACNQTIVSLASDLAVYDVIISLAREIPGYVHNWFLGARPNSCVLRSAFDEMCSNLRSHFQAATKPDIWQVTGPGLITRAVARALAVEVEGEKEKPKVLALPFDRYRMLVKQRNDLSYKKTFVGDWRNF